MKLTNIALFSATLLAIATVGCKRAEAAEGDALGTSEAQLVEDDAEASEADDDLEGDLDEPLSGAAVEEPGAPAEGATYEDLLEKVRANPGRFFKPAGCIVTARRSSTSSRSVGGHSIMPS